MSYIKNLVKSAQFFIEDIADEYLPIMKPVKQSAAKLAQEAKALMGNGAVKSANGMLGRLPYFNEIKDIGANTFKGIKTGSIYTRYGMDMGGEFDFTSHNLLSNDDGSDMGGEDYVPSSGTSVRDGDKLVAQATLDAGQASTSAAITASTRLHTDNRIFFTAFKDSMDTNLSNVSTGIEAIAKFNSNVMQQFVDQSMKYYNESLAALTDMRNVAMAQQESKAAAKYTKEETWMDKLNNGDIFGAGKAAMQKAVGHFDKGGILGVLGTVASMALPIYAQAPGQILLDLAKAGINKVTKLDGLVSLQEQMMKVGDRAGDFMSMARFSKNKTLRTIANALVPRTEDEYKYIAKTGFDGNKVLQWDAESKTALTVVIPQYLATIASGITGMEEKFYNMKENTWETREQIAEKFKSKMPNNNDIDRDLANLVNKNMSKDFKFKDEKGKQMMDIILKKLSRGLKHGSYRTKDILNMAMKKNDVNDPDGFFEVLGIQDDEFMKDFLSDGKYIGLIKDAIQRASVNPDNERRIKSMDENRLNASKKDRETMAGLLGDETNSAYIFAKSHGLGFSPSFMKNGKIDKKKQEAYMNKIMPIYQGEEDTSDLSKKAKKLYDETRAFNDTDKKMMFDIEGKEVDWKTFVDQSADNALMSRIYEKSKYILENNETLKEYLGDNEDVKKYTSGGYKNSIEDFINKKDYNPLLEVIKKNVAEEATKAAGDSMDDDKKSEMNKLLSEKSDSVRKELEAIDNNPNLTQSEKNVMKDKVTKKAASIMFDGVSSLFTGSKFFKDANKNGAVTSVAKIAGMGMAGILGANMFGGLMGHLPGLGSIMGAAGWLTPVLLSGLGLGGAIYASKTGLLENIMGKLKDPHERKELMNKVVKSSLPDLFLGGATGIASSMILKSIVPFGDVMGPIMGASLGLATGIYSRQSGLMARLFGTDDTRKNKNDHAGQMQRDRWFNLFKSTAVSALGMGGAAALLNAGGGLPIVGGVLGLGGSIISNPILFAASAVASGILLEKDSIKNKIFGDGSDKHSFTKNLGMWLFGDKESGKEGILSRQFKKFGNFMEKGSNNISKWFKESIVGNLKIGMKPFTEKMGNIGKSIVSSFMGGWDKLSDKMQSAMDKGFIKSLATAFEEKVIDPISNKISGFFNFFFKWTGKLVASPFKLFAKMFAGRTYDPEEDGEEEKPTLAGEIAKASMSRAEKRAKKKELREKKKQEKENRYAGLSAAGKIRSKIFGMGGKFKFGGSAMGKLTDNLTAEEVASDDKLRNDNSTEKDKPGSDSYTSQKGKFGDMFIGKNKIKESGCAIACAVMLINNLKTKSAVKTPEMATLAVPYKVNNDGIKPEFFEEVGKVFGLNYRRVKASSVNEDAITKVLKKKCRVIALLEKSYNGANRHYVYIYKNKSPNTFVFHDPAKGADLELNAWILHKHALEYYVFNDENAKKSIAINFLNGINKLTGEAEGGEEGEKKDGEESSEDESFAGIIKGSIQEKINSALDSAGLGFLSKFVNLGIKKLFDPKKEEEEKEEEKSEEKSEDKATETKAEETKPAQQEPEKKEKDKSAKGISIAGNGEIKFKGGLSTDRILQIINKNLLQQTNGVAYNIEYIKRILVKQLGDIDPSDKPDKKGFFSFMKMKSYKGGFMGFLTSLFDFSESPILKGIKSVWSKGIAPLFDFSKSPFLKGIGKFFDTFTKGSLNVLDSLTKGASNILTKVTGFFTKTIPDLFDKAIIKPITGLVGKMGETLAKAGTLIMDTVSDIRKASFRVLGDAYSIVTKGVGMAGKLAADITMGIGGMLFKGMGNTGLFAGAAKLLGKGMGFVGDLFGVTKLFKGIGMGLGKSWGSIMGPKKVVVAGGWIDIVKKVEGIGVVGTVDQDAYRSVTNTTRAEDAVRNSEASADNGNGKKGRNNPAGKVAQQSRASSASNATMQNSDKEQDARDKKQDKANDALIALGVSLSGAAAADKKSGGGSARGKDSDGDGIPDSQEKDNKSGGGWLKAAFGAAASYLGFKTLGKFLNKPNLSLGQKAGAVAKTGARAGMRILKPLLAATVGGGWAMSKLGQGANAVGLDGVGNTLTAAGDKISAPGQAAMSSMMDPIAGVMGVNAPTSEAIGEQMAKNGLWSLKHKYGKQFLEKTLTNNLVKHAGGKAGLEATTELVKDKSVQKYLKLAGHDIGKVTGKNAAEKATQLAAKEEFPQILKRILTSKGLQKEIAKRMGKEMSEKAVVELAEGLAKAGAKQLAKKSVMMGLRTALNYIPYVNVISIVTFFLIDFGWGWWKAPDYLKVEKPTKFMRYVAAMTNALQGTISSLHPVLWLLAAIPTEMIVQLLWRTFLKIFGTENDVNEYDKQRNEYMIAHAKELRKGSDKSKYKPYMINKIKNEDDAAGIKAFGYKHGNYSVVGEEVTKHDMDIIRNKSLKLILGDKTTEHGMNTSTLSEVMDKMAEKEDGIQGLDTRKWYSMTKAWDPFKIDTKTLLDSTRYREDIVKNKAVDSLQISQGKSNYNFAGYNYSEVGCGPEALYQVYTAYDIGANRAHMARVASYYQKYIESGQGIPWKYIIDYAVFDGFCVKPIKPEYCYVASAVMGKGYKCILLTKNPDGTSHYIAAVGATIKGSIIIADPLRKGAITEDGKLSKRAAKSTGQAYIRSDDKEFWSNVIGAVVIATNTDTSNFGFKNEPWYRLYDNAQDIISKKKNSFRFDEIGNFADAVMMFEARAWADGRFNPEANGNKKPENYDYFTQKARSIIKANNLTGTYSENEVKSMLLKDIYNDGVAPNVKYGIYKDNTNKARIGLFNTYKRDHAAPRQLKITSDGSVSMYDSQGRETSVQLNKQFNGFKESTYKMYGSTMKSYNIPLIDPEGAGTGYYPDSLRSSIKRISLRNATGLGAKNVSKLVLDEQGGYGPNKPSFITSRAKANVAALRERIESRMNSIDSAMSNPLLGKGASSMNIQPVTQVVESKQEVIRTQEVESLLAQMNNKFDKLLEVMVKVMIPNKVSNTTNIGIPSTGSINEGIDEKFLSDLLEFSR